LAHRFDICLSLHSISHTLGFFGFQLPFFTIQQELSAVRFSLERALDDERQKIRTDLHAQLQMLRHKHEFEASQLALPSGED
jgi:hypothetical protein